MGLIFVYAKLVNQSQHVPIISSASRYEKIADCVQSHLLGLAMEREGNVQSWVEKAIPKLELFSTRNIRLRTDHPETIMSHGL